MSNTSTVLSEDITICQVAVMEENTERESGMDFYPIGLGNKTKKGDAFMFRLPKHLGGIQLLITMKDKAMFQKKEDNNEKS